MLEEKVFLAFDFGMKRIGVAVGQTVSKQARPLKTLSADQGLPDWDKISRLIDEWAVSALIVGVPLNMDGTEQPMTHHVRDFIRMLKARFPLPVYTVDERLSSVEARSQIFAMGGYKKLQQVEIDSVVAALLLEDWLSKIE